MRLRLLTLAIASTAGACAAGFTFLEAPASLTRSSEDPCSARVTRTVITRLVTALNNGDVDLADQLIAKGDAFKWYSVGSERIGQAARDRSTLTSYIAARHAEGEVFRLIRFRYGGSYRDTDAQRQARFTLILVREAHDYPARWVLVKGAANCQLDPPQVAAWSLGSPPPSCSVNELRMVVAMILIDAINRGDVDSVDQVVAKGDAFKWYSVGGKAGRRTGKAASNRSTLRRYIAARHRRGERLRLIRIRYQGVTKGRHVNFSMILVRSARDYRARRVPGKGAVNCQLNPPQVAAWSLGSARAPVNRPAS
jgi:hypothetical protein